MPSGLAKLVSPTDWAGPLHAGCLNCLPAGLRGRVEWFERRNALAGPRNCTDPAGVATGNSVRTSSTGYSQDYHQAIPAPSVGVDCVVTYGYSVAVSGSVTSTRDASGAVTYSGTSYTFREITSTTYSGCPGYTDDSSDTGVEDRDTGTGIEFSNGGSPAATTTVVDTPTAHGYTRTTTTTWDSYSSASAPGSAEYIAGGYTGDPRIHYTGTITETQSYSLDEDTEEEADAAVAAAGGASSPFDWGGTPDAQFPWLGLPTTGADPGEIDPRGTMDPLRTDYSRVKNSAILRHTSAGRDVLRGRVAIPNETFPGQAWQVDWAVVTRQLGWGPARSGTAPGRTETTRYRLYTLNDAMSAPEDAVGPLAWADASWDALGYALQTVPRTPPPAAEGEPANSPTAGLRVASRLRRSRLRFATRAPGLVTFKLRWLTVLDADPATFTTALAELTTAGTLAADGTNSTDAVDYAPPDQIHSVYLFVDEVRDAAGRLLPDEAWIAPGKVRDGWLGFLQLDHASIQAGSVFYRRRAFRQQTAVTATYSPDPGSTPSEEDAACYGATGEGALPWLTFTQTQVWEQVAGGAGVPDWSLVSATGSCGAAAWTGEVSPFDEPEPAEATVAGGWSLGASTASRTDAVEPAAGERNGAIWADWARVEPVANPRFGGVTLGLATASSGTTAATYAAGTSSTVQQTNVIYLYAADAGTSVQIVNLHVRGA